MEISSYRYEWGANDIGNSAGYPYGVSGRIAVLKVLAEGAVRKNE